MRIIKLSAVMAGIALTFALALFPAAPALAQRGDALTGVVTSAEEGPMEGVLVSARKAGSTMTITVVTDEQGRYRFRTIQPGLYPGRTRHYHVKVQAPGQRLLTTQLYFPGEAANARDDFFHRELLMRVAEPGPGMAARFDFVIDMR